MYAIILVWLIDGLLCLFSNAHMILKTILLKIWQKIGVFVKKYSFFLQNLDNNIGYTKNAYFSPKIGENRRK
jgi:hypothetical protein